MKLKHPNSEWMELRNCELFIGNIPSGLIKEEDWKKCGFFEVPVSNIL